LVISEDAPRSVWERMFLAVGKSKKPTAGQQKGTLSTNLRHAGFRRPSAVAITHGVRIVLVVALPFLAFPFVLTFTGDRTATMLFLVAPAMLGYILPPMVVGRMARKRMVKIDAALPDVLDLLVLCMEAGLGMNAAVARVAQERSGMRDPLGMELGHLANELRVGVSRADALRGLAERTGSPDLRTVASQLIHTEKLGGAVGPALRAQSETVRAARQLRAEEIANKLPIKMLLPTILFIIPLFIVIMVPIGMKMMEAFTQS